MIISPTQKFGIYLLSRRKSQKNPGKVHDDHALFYVRSLGQPRWKADTRLPGSLFTALVLSMAVATSC